MVSEKSFQLLVATKTIPFFVVVPIISDHRCSTSNIARKVIFKNHSKLDIRTYPTYVNWSNRKPKRQEIL